MATKDDIEKKLSSSLAEDGEKQPTGREHPTANDAEELQSMQSATDLLWHKQHALETVSDFLIDLKAMLKQMKEDSKQAKLLQSVLPIVCVIAGGAMGFLGSFYSTERNMKYQLAQTEITERYDNAQTQLQTAQAISNLIPSLNGKDEKARKVAMVALSQLPDKTVAAKMVSLYPDQEIALKLLKQLSAEDNDQVENSLIDIANQYVAQGRDSDAVALFKHIISTLQRKLPGDTDVADAMIPYARFLRSRGRIAEADQLASQAKAIYAAHLGEALEPIGNAVHQPNR